MLQISIKISGVIKLNVLLQMYQSCSCDKTITEKAIVLIYICNKTTSIKPRTCSTFSYLFNKVDSRLKMTLITCTLTLSYKFFDRSLPGLKFQLFDQRTKVLVWSCFDRRLIIESRPPEHLFLNNTLLPCNIKRSIQGRF